MFCYLLPRESDTFYIDTEHRKELDLRTKKRGDKSKIVNQALKEYFLPKEEQEEKVDKTPEMREIEVIW